MTACEEMFSWNTLFYAVSEILNDVPSWLELAYCQETQRVATQRDAQLSWMWRKLSQLLISTSTQSSAQRFERKTVEQELTLKTDNLNDKNLQDKLQSCKHFLVDSEKKSVRHKVSIYAIETPSKKIGRKTRSGHQKNWTAQPERPSIWIHFKNCRRLYVRIFLSTRNQYPAGSIEGFVHKWWHGTAKKYPQVNWHHRFVQWRKDSTQRE